MELRALDEMAKEVRERRLKRGRERIKNEVGEGGWEWERGLEPEKSKHGLLPLTLSISEFYVWGFHLSCLLSTFSLIVEVGLMRRKNERRMSECAMIWGEMDIL